MKAKLEFDLPEERPEFEDACNGYKYSLVLSNLDNDLRSLEKYQGQELIEIDRVREMIRESLENEGLTFDI